MIRIGVVDDHPVFRLGLTRLFDREGDLTVVWGVGTIAEMEAMVMEAPVDVILLDLNLGPEQDALGATTAARKAHEDLRVIILSASLDWDAVNAARAAGANGYLPKDLSIQDMAAAIRELASPNFGRRSFTDLLKARSNGIGSLVALRGTLTRRENEVLAELRRGHTNKEIARKLGVSITTVNKHVQQVLKKLHAGTRAQAVAMVNAHASGWPYIGTAESRASSAR